MLLLDCSLLICVISSYHIHSITSNLEGAWVLFPVSEPWRMLPEFSTDECSYRTMDFIYQLLRGSLGLEHVGPLSLMWRLCSYMHNKSMSQKNSFYFWVGLDEVCVKVNKFFTSQQENRNIGLFWTKCQQFPENKHRAQISVATKWFSDINFEEFVTNLVPDLFSSFPHVIAIQQYFWIWTNQQKNLSFEI